MTTTTTNRTQLTKQEILQKAEKFLNTEFDRPIGTETEVTQENGFYHITVEIPAGFTREKTVYRLQTCPICGKVQPMNWSAFKKFNPKIAKDLLEEKRRREAEKYIEEGKQPDSNERVIKRLEERNLTWDNNYCEQRHPPLADRV